MREITVSVLFHVTYFTYHNTLETHPLRCKWRRFLFSLSSVPLYTPAAAVHTCRRTLGLLARVSWLLCVMLQGAEGCCVQEDFWKKTGGDGFSVEFSGRRVVSMRMQRGCVWFGPRSAGDEVGVDEWDTFL